MWSAKKGATLLIPSGPAHDPDRMHMHVVLTDPIEATGDVLIVCMCSIPASNLYDSSCTLFPGEHPFIQKNSYIDYGRCHIVSAARLQQKVVDKEYVAKGDLASKRFDDVMVGFADSPHVAPKFRRFMAAAS